MTIPYSIRHSKLSKHVRISVAVDGSVLVTHPSHIPLWRIEQFVAQKSDWIARKVEFFQCFRSLRRSSRKEYLEKKDAALSRVRSRVEHFNVFYGFTVGRISIRNQKTRWGSCSKQGNLSFNYRILTLPPELLDYLVVHELCHLKELNHQKPFWILVSRTFPHYAALRGALRKHVL